MKFVAIAEKDRYATDPDRPRSIFSKIFLRPKFMFYPQVIWIIAVNSRKAARGIYSDHDWASSSFEIVWALENIGIRIEITGMQSLRKNTGPVVFIGNHMSTLETLVLPGIIQPVKPVTFVVKQSLLTTPFFGPIMRSRDPVVVGRTNPREDLRTVLEDGTKKLSEGKSIVIFPQSTRSVDFNPSEFNSLGIKLALKAGVPVVPVALKTDAWGIGRFIKDFGTVDRTKKVHFAFGEPLRVSGRGADEHQMVIGFIREKLREWSRGDKK